MSTIKNIHQLAGIIPAADIDKLDAGAALHLRHSNISFKIIKAFNDEVHVRTEQGKHLSENYATTQTLVTRTRELFERFFPGKTIYVHPVPYAEPVVNQVDAAWINKKMLDKGIKARDIVNDTGLNKPYVSSLINGKAPLSQITKAFFYYYFTR